MYWTWREAAMIRDLLYRMRSILQRGSMESELDDEIQFHVERETEKLLGRGVEPVEARRQARLAFGFRDLVKEQCRDERGTGWVENLGRDVAFAARLLRRNASFTAVALLSLGMGIGANTAIFQLLDAVRLRDLPVKTPRDLYEVVIGGDGPGGGISRRGTAGYRMHNGSRLKGSSKPFRVSGRGVCDGSTWRAAARCVPPKGSW
jgi:hypothetical protein